MGDMSTGLGYLCGMCCCGSQSEVSADGSHFRSRAKEDPRERQIDEVFLARNYRQDSSGRFHTEPTPKSSMLVTMSNNERQISQESKKSSSKGSDKSKEIQQEDHHDGSIALEGLPLNDNHESLFPDNSQPPLSRTGPSSLSGEKENEAPASSPSAA